jgi:large subunit ribosomal protein L6
MSRIGKQPVVVPAGVKLQVLTDQVTAEGSKGKVSVAVPRGITVAFDETTRRITVSRAAEDRQHRALHGTIRSLLNNMVKGVSEGFVRRLEINGIGYNAKLNGRVVELSVGFSKPVRVDIPAGLAVDLPNPTIINITGADKELLGQFTSSLRKIRPPEPYKGKGLRYEGEEVRRKAGKAVAGHEL